MKNTLARIIGLSLALLIIFSLLFFNSKYFIRLNGDKRIKLNLNEEYIEQNAKTLFNKIIYTNDTVNINRVGIYELKYYHLNSYITRFVEVIDDIKPKIKLIGDAEVNIVLNSEYIEPGYSAFDNYDLDITNKVIVNNNLDITKIGSYEIIYTVEDDSHNKDIIKRKVNVNEVGPMAMSIKDFTLNGYFTNTILKETTSDDNYLKDTIFYGDSITENFAYYQNIPYDNIWAASNLTPSNAHIWNVMFYKYNTKINITEGFKIYKPKRVIILIGANAVAVMDKDYFISEYERLIIKLKENSPSTKLIVCSITPVDSRWDYKANTINNTKINNINYLLASMCERQNIKFLNVAEALKNEYGTALNGYFYENDGIHLLPNANDIFINYVKTHRYE